MEHLACFAPGMLALGALQGDATMRQHASLAAELMCTCFKLYADTVSGLAPDSIVFTNGKGNAAASRIVGVQAGQSGYRISNAKFSLRPETVESLFYMWRLTHNQTCMLARASS